MTQLQIQMRYEFALTLTQYIGFGVGSNNDITENKFVGNTYVILKLSNASGTFTESEKIVDSDNNSATVKVHPIRQQSSWNQMMSKEHFKLERFYLTELQTL